MFPDRSRTSVLLIRAWTEQDSGQQLTVRVIHVDPGVAGQRDVYVASVDEAIRHVRQWLTDLAGDLPVTNGETFP